MTEIFSENLFRLPADFEEHLSTWLIWPYRLDTWYDEAKPARRAYANVANAISEFEKVNLIIRKEDREYSKKLLNNSIQLYDFPFNSEWARDIGPVFVKDGTDTVGIDFRFDSWCEIYSDYDLDDVLGSVISKSLNYPVIRSDIILEGGSINVDGEGTLITTEECFFNDKRKSVYSKEKLEKVFREYFGITKTIWLKRGVYKDVVNGHVDNLCVFTRPQQVVLTWTDDKNDPQYEISHEAFEILSSEKDAKGRNIEIVKMHQPDPMYTTAEESAVVGESFVDNVDRLCASYVNFYLVNGGVIIPSFNDKKYDPLAKETISKLFPNRKVMQIPTREILLGGGGIHCITMQEPV